MGLPRLLAHCIPMSKHSHDAPLYSWERLEIYAMTNRLARTLGHLLAGLPSRNHVHVHNLIGQTVVMSQAVAGANQDVAPGQTVSLEHRRVWLTIGETAARCARDLLIDLAHTTKRCHREMEEALALVNAIETEFRSSSSLLELASPPPMQIHQA